MSLTAKANDGEGFARAPEGTHVARCFKIVDLGTQYNAKYDKNHHKIMLVWELPEELIPDGELAGQPFAVSGWYTLSLGEKANLRKDLESWRGKSFTSDELAGFNISKLLGATCLLNLVHNTVDDKTYVNISSIMKMPKTMECPASINDLVIFDIDEFDEEVFETFSDNLKAKIKESKEYKEKETGGSNQPVGGEEALICPACNADLNGEMDCPNPKCPSKNSQNERSDQPHES